MEIPIARDQLVAATDGKPRYEAIASAFEQAIAAARIRPGDRLPAVRQLSMDLGVSAATITAAYNLLNQRGWTRGEVGRGTFVNTPGSERSSPAVLLGGPPAMRRATPWRRRALTTSAARLRSSFPAAFDCTSGKPDVTLLPLAILQRAWRHAIDDMHHMDLQYAGPDPIPALIRALLPRLEHDGIPARVPDIVIGSSAQQFIVLAMSAIAALRVGGETVVAVEEPGYQTAYDTFERAGYRLVGVAVDEQGAVPASLDAALAAGATGVLLIPRAHNPTGVSWSARRLVELGDVLAAHPDAFAVEDDQLADVASARAGSLLSDPRIEDRIVYIRSFAKAIAPDLRLACAVARPRLRALLAEAKSFADGWSSLLAQRALANVLSDRELEGVLSTARDTYRARRVAALHAINTRLELVGGGATGADGINIWVHLPSGVDAVEVIEQAAAAGVLVAPGEPFFIRPGHSDVLRMSVGWLKNIAEAEMAGDALATAALSSTSAAVGASTMSV